MEKKIKTVVYEGIKWEYEHLKQGCPTQLHKELKFNTWSRPRINFCQYLCYITNYSLRNTSELFQIIFYVAFRTKLNQQIKKIDYTYKSSLALFFFLP